MKLPCVEPGFQWPLKRKDGLIMSIECSIFAVSSTQIAAFRGNPEAASNEARLRNALEQMSTMLHLRPELTEAEYLADLGSNTDLDQLSDPKDRAELAAYHDRDRAMLEAALARGDRETAFCLGKSWDLIHRVISADDQNSDGWFLVGGEPLGETLTYGPPSLRCPEDVLAFAAYLAGWSSSRFLAACEVLRTECDEGIDAVSIPSSQQQQLVEIAKIVREAEMALFERFRAYVADASDARSGMLIWFN